MFGCLFDQPGVGGSTTPLSDQNGKTTLGGYASVWSDANSVVLLTNPQTGATVYASFSSDGIHFTSLPEPIYQFGFPGSWMFFPAARSVSDGSSTWSGTFNFFYVFWPYGLYPSTSYVAVRPVTVTQNASPVSGPQVGVQLSRYYKQISPILSDSWATDFPMVDSGYNYQTNLGYLLTKQPSGSSTITLWDCQLSNGKHWIAADSSGTSNCASLTGDSGATTLQSLGWIYPTQQQNTKPLYSCVSGSVPSGVWFVSNDPGCEGSLGFQANFLGYILSQ